MSEDNALYAISSGIGSTTSTLAADAEGSLTVEGDTSGQSGTDTSVDEDITSITGDFEDTEVLTITDSALTATSASAVSGTLEVEGASSGATGQFAASLTFSAQTATATGTVNISGDTSGGTGTFTCTADSVTLLSGTFNNGEVLNITGASLNATATPDVTGTLTVAGASSSATGNITITTRAITGVVGGPFVAETASVTSSALTVAATAGVNFSTGETCSVTGSDLEANVTGTAGEAAEDVALYRLLLHESNSEWESADDTTLTNPDGLWLTPGTNVLWTIDDDGDADGCGEMWVLEDTLSGQVTLSTPPDGYQSDREDQMRVSWEELRDAEEYEVKYYHLDTGDSDVKDGVEDTDTLLTQLNDSSEYEWKVRVDVGEPWHSRWSGKWTFHTALGEAPWAPDLYTPGGLWQYSGVEVELMPAFSWESANTADSYQFVLADNATFASPLVDTQVPESAYQLDFELEYNSNYFWRVQAYKGDEALSRWSDVGAFTTIAKPVPPTTPPPPVTPTLTVEPIIQPTPIPLWALISIIAIGGILMIGVIVLVWRTRRAV
ncbi:hypothetical protein ES703_48351 [subsurface metagenome]